MSVRRQHFITGDVVIVTDFSMFDLDAPGSPPADFFFFKTSSAKLCKISGLNALNQVLSGSVGHLLE